MEEEARSEKNRLEAEVKASQAELANLKKTLDEKAATESSLKTQVGIFIIVTVMQGYMFWPASKIVPWFVTGFFKFFPFLVLLPMGEGEMARIYIPAVIGKVGIYTIPTLYMIIWRYNSLNRHFPFLLELKLRHRFLFIFLIYYDRLLP